MRPRRFVLTVHEMMVMILGVGLLLGWIIGWEQLRIQERRGVARAILNEDPNDPLASRKTREEIIEASQYVENQARPWAEGWPRADVIACGVIIDLGVIGLTLSFSKLIALEVRKRRRKAESLQEPWEGRDRRMM